MRDSKLEECQQNNLDPPSIACSNNVVVTQKGDFPRSVLDSLITVLAKGDLHQVEAHSRNGDRVIITSR